MANHCRTTCTVTGPDTEIARFKQTCLITTPRRLSIHDPDESDGIGFTDTQWETTQLIYWSTYCFHEGQHQVWVNSAWEPPVASLEKISALFPELTFDLQASDEFCNFAIKGSIKAGVADLQRNLEAMCAYDEGMADAGAFAKADITGAATANDEDVPF